MAAVPTGFTLESVAGGLSGPTAMAQTPDHRLLITQQNGALRVIKNDTLIATPALTLAVDSAGERGLLGVAVDPTFASTHFIYLYYTVPAGQTAVHNRLSRFTLAGDTVASGSESVLLDLDPLTTATNHNGGAVHFGPDGKLFVAVGDNANSANAQALTTVKGKILRLNPDGSVPSDNPFLAQTTANNRFIWARGLRNPFSFAFDPSTGRMLINDVGQSTWEEVDPGVAGANYGWPTTEGAFNAAQFPTFTQPAYSYDHAGGRIAIVGAAFSNAGFDTLSNRYFFADLGADVVYAIDPAAPPAANAAPSVVTGLSSPVDLLYGADDALYVLERGGGSNTGTLSRVLADVAQNDDTYVTHLYNDLLGRDPDPTGLTVWTAALAQGRATGQVDEARQSVARQILGSDERLTSLVQSLYTTYLHRAADPGGLSHWLTALRAGTPLRDVRLAFLGSDEYRLARSGGLPVLLLANLYQDVLARPQDPTGQAAFLPTLATPAGQGQVTAAILDSGESRGKQVSSFYTTYLRRLPDAPGLAAWTDALGSGLGEDEIAARILASAEYYRRP